MFLIHILWKQFRIIIKKGTKDEQSTESAVVDPTEEPNLKLLDGIRKHKPPNLTVSA